MNMFLGKILSWIVRGYQLLVSPWMPPSCRFYPTCSEYSRISYIRHGFLRGTWLTVTRILRCNPWNPGGYDPVPPLPGEKTDSPDSYIPSDKHSEARSGSREKSGGAD